VRDQVSHPHKTTGKIITLLIFYLNIVVPCIIKSPKWRLLF
jgi:hypothetical protein